MRGRKPVCLFVGCEPTTASAVEQQVLSVGCGFRRVHLEAHNVRLITSVSSGCMVVDLDSVPNAIEETVALFQRERCSMPVVGLVEDLGRYASLSGRISGVFAFASPHDVSGAINRVVDLDASGLDAPARMRAQINALTDREAEVILRFLDGGNSKSIAKQLGITVQTVDKHRNRVLRKLGVRSAVELHNKVQTLLLLSLGLISHSAEKSESGPSPESESDAGDQTSAETGRRDIA